MWLSAAKVIERRTSRQPFPSRLLTPVEAETLQSDVICKSFCLGPDLTSMKTNGSQLSGGSALENDLPDLTSFSLSSFRGIVDNQSPNEKNFAKMSSDMWMNKSLGAVISSY
ncbi:hypothetical protein TNIN_306221 [Trichonephila inaurata madagascariensis]|uniref:Uncharacterized protein n=1 Tax=Trichonephila inaurata madagascariensis TaxID=2747483 RepID=A0A8X7BSX6_9ARAC|nr:hypothetical protein TNIN_306221 [Trichonephila inaurata madagascariensis]